MSSNNWLNERLRQYVAAEKAVLLGGQSYTIGNRRLTRADLAEIRAEIKSLVNAGATLEDTVPRRTCRRIRIIPVE